MLKQQCATLNTAPSTFVSMVEAVAPTKIVMQARGTA